MDQATVEERKHEGLPLEVRKVKFDWAGTPLHWVPDDPFSTHMINVLHLLLPAGERWFIDVVREAQPFVDDEGLRQVMKPFIGQEAWHANAHALVLDHLAQQGIDTEAYTGFLDHWFKHIMSAHPSWPRPLQRWWMRRRLAEVAAIEHYTAVLGRWVLENHGLDQAGADATMLSLLRWHGSEEIEHRSLVFDVHTAVGGRYSQKVTAMMFAGPMLLLFWVAGLRYLMRHDPTLDGANPRWRDWMRAARAGKVPGPALLLGAMPRYMRPGHHPSTEVSTDLGLDYLHHSGIVQALAS
jgi:uncharacterized protein